MAVFRRKTLQTSYLQEAAFGRPDHPFQEPSARHHQDLTLNEMFGHAVQLLLASRVSKDLKFGVVERWVAKRARLSRSADELVHRPDLRPGEYRQSMLQSSRRPREQIQRGGRLTSFWCSVEQKAMSSPALAQLLHRFRVD